MARFTALFLAGKKENRTPALTQAAMTALAVGRVAADQNLPARTRRPGGADRVGDHRRGTLPRATDANCTVCQWVNSRSNCPSVAGRVHPAEQPRHPTGPDYVRVNEAVPCGHPSEGVSS